ncbi:MAG: hypothetical protein PHY72_01255 [Candidatus Pacebacteria bacterium]|nr:hypothetical protein [Candidatus Paceibacterota bacterium]
MNKNKAIKISKEILKYLLISGAILIAASSPYFASSLIRDIKRFKAKDKQKVNSAFQYLRRNGLIKVEKYGFDARISLTEKGKKRAGKYQINDLKIEIPNKWDGKWRVIIFDIPDISKTVRNIFRTKLKEFNFYSLQKSVWVHPYNCKKEIEILRDFLGANSNQIQFILAEEIEHEEKLKKVFKII